MSEIASVQPAEAKELVDSGKYTLLDVRYGSWGRQALHNPAAAAGGARGLLLARSASAASQPPPAPGGRPPGCRL